MLLSGHTYEQHDCCVLLNFHMDVITVLDSTAFIASSLHHRMQVRALFSKLSAVAAGVSLGEQISKLRKSLYKRGYTDAKIAELMPMLGADSQIDRIVKQLSAFLHRKVKLLVNLEHAHSPKTRTKISRSLSDNDKDMDKLLKEWKVLLKRASPSYRDCVVPASAKDLKGIGDIRKIVNVSGVAPSLLSASERAIRMDVIFRRAEAFAARTEVQILISELHHTSTYYRVNRAAAIAAGAAVLQSDLGRQSAGASHLPVQRVVVRAPHFLLSCVPPR